MSVLLPLLLKMGLAAMIVVLASLAVERTGPMIGALIATLPVAGGPAYVFLASPACAGYNTGVVLPKTGSVGS